jgi:hypothetical protein
MVSMNPAQLEKHLKGVSYPASKAELVKYMESSGADECVCEAISCLPNQTYDSSAAVSRAVYATQQDQDRNQQDQSQQGRQKASR